MIFLILVKLGCNAMLPSVVLPIIKSDVACIRLFSFLLLIYILTLVTCYAFYALLDLCKCIVCMCFNMNGVFISAKYREGLNMLRVVILINLWCVKFYVCVVILFFLHTDVL